MSAGNRAFRDEKVYLHPIVLVFPGWVGVEEQLAVIGHEHLRHDILHQHPSVDFQLVFENLLVKLFRDNPPLIEGMANHQAGVVHIAFQGIVFLFEAQSDAGFCGVEGQVHHLGIAQPKERAGVIAEAGILVQVGQLELMVVQLKLCGDGFIDGIHFGGVFAGIAVDAVMVKVEYLSLYAVNIFERAGVLVLQYGLGHTADKQVEARAAGHNSISSNTMIDSRGYSLVEK